MSLGTLTEVAIALPPSAKFGSYANIPVPATVVIMPLNASTLRMR